MGCNNGILVKRHDVTFVSGAKSRQNVAKMVRDGAQKTSNRRHEARKVQRGAKKVSWKVPQRPKRSKKATKSSQRPPKAREIKNENEITEGSWGGPGGILRELCEDPGRIMRGSWEDSGKIIGG